MTLPTPNPDSPATRVQAWRAAQRLGLVLAGAAFVGVSLVVIGASSLGTDNSASNAIATPPGANVRPQPAMYGPALAEPGQEDTTRSVQQPPAVAPPRTPREPGDWIEPLVIDNPAAFGPPEDGSIPGPPSVRRPQPIIGVAKNDATPASHVARRGPTAFLPVAASGSGAQSTKPKPAAKQPTPLTDTDRASFTASTTDLSRRLTPMVRTGFKLGRAGAMYAARNQFIEVLRRITNAKDAAEGSDRHAQALAAGLRALDEADDFSPRGDVLEAELDVPAIAQSHTTPVVREHPAKVTPHDAVAMYSRFAADQIGSAVRGEPAGSMALYGLGKTYARVEAQSNDPHAGRKCLVMHRAALRAHADNHLAANELGVRLAMAGRYEQASEALRLAASQPGAAATVYENLAQVESRLGRVQVAQQAIVTSQEIAQAEIASGELSRRHGVTWVSPQAFSGGGPLPGPVPSMTAPPRAPTPAPAPTATVAEQPDGRIAKAIDFVKRKSGWSKPAPPAPPQQPYYPVATRPMTTVVR